MIFNQTSNKFVCLDSFKQYHDTKEFVVDKVDDRRMMLVKTKIQITITHDNHVKYIYDGIILRNELFLDTSQNPEILTNMEQIKYLRWQGEYGQDMKKQGKWRAMWNEVALLEVGGYNIKVENNYTLKMDQSKAYGGKQLTIIGAQVYEIGEYFQGQKRGMWNYFYKKNKIGGGSYNEISVKNGKWVELSCGFQDNSQVTYKGEYKNGKRVGTWDIFYKNKQFGGGQYDELGNGIKIGGWFELSDRFYEDTQVIYDGKYQNGKKIGGWDIMLNRYIVGGGFYDDQGNGTKIGMWSELCDRFDDISSVYYYGEYKNDKRVDRWDIEDNRSQFNGGGIYNDNGDKIGQWIDLCEGFGVSKITYNGLYKNGNKVGRWDTKLSWGETNQVGGGSYDEGVKIGKWIDISERFRSGEQITYLGEYRNGKKISRWDVLFQNKQIGGGSYDKEGNGIKIGTWIEEVDGFNDSSSITYNGEYKDGQKFGRWDIFDTNELIGGGTYDDNGDKIGLWIVLNHGYKKGQEIIYTGQYKNSIKIGRWDILYRDWTVKFDLIGGGSYGEEGDGIQIGRWIEQSNEFKRGQEIRYDGDYHLGKKVGRWDSIYGYRQTGGGSYDDDGDEIKQGEWIELSDEFNNRLQTVFIGEYRKGKKVGKWVEKAESDRGITYEEIIYDD